MTDWIVHREPVRDDWIDYNGHLSEAYYVLVLGHATDAVMDAVGLDAAYRERTATSLFTVEAHVRYLAQVGAGAELEVRSAVVAADARRLHLWHELWVADTLRATEEVLCLHVDTSAGRSSPFPSALAGRIRALGTVSPAHAGRRIHLG